MLLLMDESAEAFGADERRTLAVIEREMGSVLTFLAARDETEAVKADFMSMIVHDLRSPLAGILAGADILKGGMAGQLTPDQLQAPLKRFNRKEKPDGTDALSAIRAIS